MVYGAVTLRETKNVEVDVLRDPRMCAWQTRPRLCYESIVLTTLAVQQHTVCVLTHESTLSSLM